MEITLTLDGVQIARAVFPNDAAASMFALAKMQLYGGSQSWTEAGFQRDERSVRLSIDRRRQGAVDVTGGDRTGEFAGEVVRNSDR